MHFEEEAFTEQEGEDYILLVFLVLITTKKPSLTYHLRVHDLLRSGLLEGFGGMSDAFPQGTPEFELIRSFERNINAFTAAKQYQMIRDMGAFLGLDREKFFEKARAVFRDYNQNWLVTEFDTVINASRTGRSWIGFEKDKERRPLLTYNTQRDARVRPEHVVLDGITKPIDDPFWDSYAPPNGWNCRCFLTSSSTAQVTPNSKIPLTQLEKEVPDFFKFNPAKTGMIFSNMHPYFEIARGDRQLRRSNFNIPAV